MGFDGLMPIDCDIHPAVPGMQALLPYIDDHWRETIISRGIDGLDLNLYPPGAEISCRPDWRPESGKPGTSFEQLRTQALDGFGARIAICNCLYGGPAMYSEDLGAAICRATNLWMAREWLDRDPRLRASIVVPVQSPELAVEEIERCAPDRRFVQVLMFAAGEQPLGRRPHWPIYEAAQRHGLPIGIHAGSSHRHPNSGIGWTQYLLQDHAAFAQTFQAQLLSLLAEGVFSRFPTLKFVLMESGFTWLPPFMWRAVKMWRGLRREIPWVDRSPADIIRERVRITIQPADAPPDPAQMRRTLEMIGADEMFLFSSDYPHWRFEGEAALPGGFSPELVRKILVDNPLATYPRLKEVLS
ncbi:amidohydrolase family protein [Roseococcus sp. SYP-B2431]|uniref:amidohydrolase family protein n=1 Tax=Roseococcus sp. SYP-B2431 TaxID=2496640 RepID=UPI001981E955|nr:amidohydrolase family protein [Roseococcus sp. SYP-B2431]